MLLPPGDDLVLPGAGFGRLDGAVVFSQGPGRVIGTGDAFPFVIGALPVAVAAFATNEEFFARQDLGLAVFVLMDGTALAATACDLLGRDRFDFDAVAFSPLGDFRP